MTETPDWVGKPYPQVSSGTPARADQWTQLPQDQVAAMSARLTESMMQRVVQSLRGLFVPTGQVGAAEDQLADFGSDVGANSENLDIIIGGIADPVLGTTTTNPSDVGIAVEKINLDIIGNTKAIQFMQATDAGEHATGQTVTINFADYADGPMPGIFSITYSGVGTSELIVDNGQAQWDKANNANRDALVRYNVAPTDTDFQILRGTMALPPEDPSTGGTPHFYACARMSSDAQAVIDGGHSYVWARARSIASFFQYRADIGCTIAGVETVWVTNIPLTWSMGMTFVAGVGLNERQYQVWSGATLVYTHTEVGTASMLGANYRHWGSLAQLRHDSAGIPNAGGKVAACAVADNQLPATIGVSAAYYRTGTGTVNFTGSDTVTALPSNFFSHVGRACRAIETDTATGDFTISKEGAYIINGRVKLSTALTSSCNLVLEVNGAVVDWGPGVENPTGYEGLSYSGLQYLEAGDVVRLATIKSGTTGSFLTGEATGTQTYFNIARIPDATAAP
jgi:hypothetical protein